MSYIEMEKSPTNKTAVHPKVSVMVNTAITVLAEPKGSSIRAINKYLSANYNVDVKKLSVYIKKYLKSAVELGELVQPTGKGASGSFKMAKQKREAKLNATKGKSLKPLKMPTSTPKRPLKPKKTATPNQSPVKKANFTDDEEAPADATFTKPNKKIVKKPKVSVPTKTRKSKVSLPAKVKKPKKLMAKKVKEAKDAASPKDTLNKTVPPTKNAKPKDAAKTTKVKKSAKPGKNAASGTKKAVSKKKSAED